MQLIKYEIINAVVVVFLNAINAFNWFDIWFDSNFDSVWLDSIHLGTFQL